MLPQPDFLAKPLHDMTKVEWESLCDGCGLCCQIREVDDVSDEIALTNVACRYLCLNSLRCKDYENRQANVDDCIKITPGNVGELDWLPHSCAYRVVMRGEPLPSWHHLVSGDKEQVHMSGPSMKGELVSEDDVEADRWE